MIIVIFSFENIFPKNLRNDTYIQICQNTDVDFETLKMMKIADAVKFAETQLKLSPGELIVFTRAIEALEYKKV